MLIIDLLYETHAATQFSNAQFISTLVAPPILGFFGNVFCLFYILYFLKGNIRAQTLQLIAMGMRELVEIMTSCGVSFILSTMWFFQKQNYYM